MTPRPAPRRPPPVGDARIDALQDVPEELAKRWLTELIAARPLAEAGTLASPLFLQRAPSLCAQVLKALGSDPCLDELQGAAGPAGAGPAAGLASGLGELLAARDGAVVVEAAEALRAALWLLCTEATAEAPGGELADRLAHVCAALAARALAGAPLRASQAGPPGGEPAAGDSAGAAAGNGLPGEPPGEWPYSAPPEPAEASAGAHEPGSGVEVELADGPGEATAKGAGVRYPRIEIRPATAAAGPRDAEDAWRIDAAAATEPAGGRHADRYPDSPSWSSIVADQLEGHAAGGSPFAVLAIELLDVERLRHSVDPPELDALLAVVEAALRAQVRPAELIGQQSPGRWWLLAPETRASGARVLAERLAQAVRAGASHRGSALEVAIGVAVCPQDGSGADELAERAEAELYAARAAGLAVAPAG